MEISECWFLLLDIVSKTAYQHDIYQKNIGIMFCVHIFQKCHNLYSVTEQDAIYHCLKVLLWKKNFFNMALSGNFKIFTLH